MIDINQVQRDFDNGVMLCRETIRKVIELAAKDGGEVRALTDDDIDEIWESMSEGSAGWLINFGYQQFARKIEGVILDNLTPQSIVNDAEFLRLADVWQDAAIQDDGTAMQAWRRFISHIDSCSLATPKPEASAANQQAGESLLKWALRELISTLPQKRDWLNPDAEQVLRDRLAAPVSKDSSCG